MRTLAGWIASAGELGDGVSEESAAVTLWTLAGPDVHRMLVDQRGSTKGQYVDWLEQTLVKSLLPPA